MKIINSFKYLIVSVLLFSTSCQDFTDIEPKNVIAANLALTNLNDYNQALFGAYDVMQTNSYYGSDYSMMPDILTDNLKVTSENRNFYFVQRLWSYTSTDDPGMWSTLYAMLNRVNTVIGGVGQFEAEDPAYHNRILAQALSLRAMIHFDLLRYYGINYQRNDATTQGGIVVATAVLSPEAQPVRNTVEETYNQIYADLNAAEALYANTGTVSINASAGERHYMDLNAMKALRARVSLYAQDWDDAIDYATDVIAEFPLASSTDFPTMWTDETFAAENILSVPYSNAEGGFDVTNILWGPNDPVNPLASGEAQFTYSDVLVGSYTSTDVRFTSWVANAPAGKSYTYIQTKYPNDDSSIFSDFKVFRTGEMYLILAEAYFRNGDNDNARTFLNTLREARDPDLTVGAGTPSAGQLDLFISLERRKELLVEGHRWFDIRRYRDIPGVPTALLNVLRDGSDDTLAASAGALSVPNDRLFIFPIPQDEIFANLNIRQAGGW